MENETVEEAIEQLKATISEMKEVKTFALKQNGNTYELIVESQDGLICRFNQTMMDIYFYICKYGINNFCLAFSCEIIHEFKKERKINKALEQAYKNKDKNKIKKLLELKIQRDKIDSPTIKQYVTIKEGR